MSGMSSKNRCAFMICWISMHSESITIKRIEAGIGIPGFVEVNAVHAWIKQLLYTLGVVAKPVIGGVGHHRIHWVFLNAIGHERICINSSLNSILLQASRRNGPDDSIAIAQGNEIGGYATCQH